MASLGPLGRLLGAFWAVFEHLWPSWVVLGRLRIVLRQSQLFFGNQNRFQIRPAASSGSQRKIARPPPWDLPSVASGGTSGGSATPLRHDTIARRRGDCKATKTTIGDENNDWRLRNDENHDRRPRGDENLFHTPTVQRIFYRTQGPSRCGYMSGSLSRTDLPWSL